MGKKVSVSVFGRRFVRDYSLPEYIELAALICGNVDKEEIVRLFSCCTDDSMIELTNLAIMKKRN